MLRKQSKKLAIMLVLSMIASLFVGVGAASGAVTAAARMSGRNIEPIIFDAKEHQPLDQVFHGRLGF